VVTAALGVVVVVVEALLERAERAELQMALTEEQDQMPLVAQVERTPVVVVVVVLIAPEQAETVVLA
jgi:hypothetical protein